jgi:prevent-host-death family protein
MNAPKKKTPPPTPKKFTKRLSIPVGQFKARYLDLMDQVRDRHCEIVITRRGKPVAKLVPYEQKSRDIFGYLKGSVVIHDDIIEPTGEVWEADA